MSELPPEQHLAVYSALVKYATEGEEPNFSDIAMRICFHSIKQRLDADTAKYEKISEKRAEAGRLGGKQTQANSSKSKQAQANSSKNKQAQARPSYIDIDIDNDIDNDIEDIEKKDINISQKKRFVKPTPEEVDAYCKERGNNIKGEDFCNYYEAKGWLVGKSPMKDWRAAVRTWERNRKSDNDDKGDKYDWDNDPDLPNHEEWEAFLQFVNKHGGLTLTPYQYSDIKVQTGFNDLSKQQLADVIVECCRRGKNYLSDNLQWKLSEVIRYIKNRNNG